MKLREYVLLPVLVALLACLRMIPANDSAFRFNYDDAFNFRMTVEVIRHGHVPAVDQLSGYPEGRNVAAFLPTGLYHTVSFFHVLLLMFFNVDLTRTIFIFCSMVGSFIVIPVYFLARRMCNRTAIAALSAFLAGIIPAYLDRTFCCRFRYETFGAPLLFASLAFFVGALCASHARKAAVFALVSGLFVVAAQCVWRVAVLFPALYVLALLYLAMKTRPIPRRWFLVVIAAALLPLLWQACGLCAGGMATGPRFAGAVFELLTYKAGMLDTLTPFTRILSCVEELRSASPVAILAGPSFLAFSGVFLVCFIIMYVLHPSGDVQRDVLFVFAICLFALTVILKRSGVLLGPVCALCMAQGSARAARLRPRWLRLTLALATALILTETSFVSLLLLAHRRAETNMSPALTSAIQRIDATTASNAAILAPWPDGYALQTYANRATPLDGFLESQDNIAGIVRTAKLLLSQDETRLWTYCRQRGITHLLVNSTRGPLYAMEAGIDPDSLFGKGGLTTEGRNIIYCRMISRPDSLSRFRELYRNGEYVLLGVADEKSVAPPETTTELESRK